jgi:hypothetical protein
MDGPPILTNKSRLDADTNNGAASIPRKPIGSRSTSSFVMMYLSAVSMAAVVMYQQMAARSLHRNADIYYDDGPTILIHNLEASMTHTTLISLMDSPFGGSMTKTLNSGSEAVATTTKTSSNDGVGGVRKPMVVVVACSRSQPHWITNPRQSVIVKSFFPSLTKSITPKEMEQYDIQILLGFDSGDKFWEMQTMRKLVSVDLFPDIPINFVSINKGTTRPSRIPFNEACQAAYEYGADYIVRVNDDTEFMSRAWVTKSINALQSYLIPNVGVVGPTDVNNKKILTHDMTHRTHLDIFNRYYPDVFDNWWIDDWITHVYGQHRTTMLKDWLVVNRNKLNSGQRYKVDRRLGKHLNVTVEKGQLLLDDFLRRYNNSTRSYLDFHPHNFCVLGTNRIALLDGPIQDFVKQRHDRLPLFSTCLSSQHA